MARIIRVITDEQACDLYYAAQRPREAVEHAKSWLLDCSWNEDEEEVEEAVGLLNHVGVVRMVERHYDGGYMQFLRDGDNVKPALVIDLEARARATARQ